MKSFATEPWKGTYNIDIDVRFGINTGDYTGGNLWSKRLFDYTGVGANVNLAQRFEANAPLGGILVSEFTFTKQSVVSSAERTMNIHSKGYDYPIPGYVISALE